MALAFELLEMLVVGGDDDEDDAALVVIGTGLKLLLFVLFELVRCNAVNLLSNDVNEVGLMLLSLKYFSDSIIIIISPWRLRREI